MYDMPRVPRSRSQAEAEEKVVFGCGCVSLLIAIAFWGTVAYVVGHFVLKYW